MRRLQQGLRILPVPKDYTGVLPKVMPEFERRGSKAFESDACRNALQEVRGPTAARTAALSSTRNAAKIFSAQSARSEGRVRRQRSESKTTFNATTAWYPYQSRGTLKIQQCRGQIKRSQNASHRSGERFETAVRGAVPGPPWAVFLNRRPGVRTE